jgi:hypothetical protein
MRYFSEDGKTNVIVSMYKKGARYKDKQVKPDLVFRQFDIDWSNFPIKVWSALSYDIDHTQSGEGKAAGDGRSRWLCVRYG